jgi:hypothetical protein
MTRLAILAIAGVFAAAAEPAPRTLPVLPLKIAAPFAHVTGVFELASGKLLISDVKTPGLWLLDPASGTATPVGAPGADPTQYTEPGGFYAGKAGTILLADHSGPRAITFSAAGQITGGYGTARRGVRSSSDSDSDATRLDSRGFAYFADYSAAARIVSGNETAGIADVIRLDPEKQIEAVVAKLTIGKARQISNEGGWVITRGTVGDPADGWAVLPDGRLAIVRAKPYRIEWIGVDGKSTLGPEIPIDAIPFTQQDRDAFSQSAPSAGVGAAGSNSRANQAGGDRKFADVKPPFSPEDITASPDGRVWVKRSAPFGATAVIYDVFDGAGRRADRIELPAGSRVVGFGPSAVYVRQVAGKAVQIRKYKLS